MTQPGSCPQVQDMSGNDMLRKGTVLNKRYKIIRSLGGGGFSAAYLVYDTELEVNAAVKECFPFRLAARGADGEEVTVQEEKQDEFARLKADFQKEAGFIYGMYDQPGVCAVKDFFTENNTVYIVEEFLPGGTLKEYLKKQPGGRITAEECLEMMRPVMSGIAMLHERGAVHGDISPDNLLFDGQGQLKLIDYGSVYDQEDRQDTNRTFKPCYAAPEQYLEKGRSLTGPWTDLYSLCAVIYECLTGKRPPTVQERLKNRRLKPIRDFADVSAAFDQGILQGMELDIPKRFFYMGTLQERIGCPDPGVKERLPKTREIWSEKWMQAATENLQLGNGKRHFFTAQQKRMFLKAEFIVLGIFGAVILVLFVWVKMHPLWELDMHLRQARVRAVNEETDVQSDQTAADEPDEDTLASLEPYLSSEDSDGTRHYYKISYQWFQEHPQYKSSSTSLWTDIKYLVPDVSLMEEVLSWYSGRKVPASKTEISGYAVVYNDGKASFVTTGEKIYYLPDGGEVTLQYNAGTERISEVMARGRADKMTSFLKNIFPYVIPQAYLTDDEIAGLFSEADTVREQKDGTVFYKTAVIDHNYYRLTADRQSTNENQSEADRNNGEYRLYIAAR